MLEVVSKAGSSNGDVIVVVVHVIVGMVVNARGSKASR